MTEQQKFEQWWEGMYGDDDMQPYEKTIAIGAWQEAKQDSAIEIAKAIEDYKASLVPVAFMWANGSCNKINSYVYKHKDPVINLYALPKETK